MGEENLDEALERLYWDETDPNHKIGFFWRIMQRAGKIRYSRDGGFELPPGKLVTRTK
jgi:flagellar basal body rod protein FlgG